MAQDLVISVPEVQRRQNEGEIVFLDARNPQAWAESEEKLPGAIRVPADALNEHIQEIPRGRTLVAYCT